MKKILYVLLLVTIVTIFTGCTIRFKRNPVKGLPELSDIKYIDIDDRSNISNKRFDEVVKITDKNADCIGSN